MAIATKDKHAIELEIGAIISCCTDISLDEIISHHRTDPLTGSSFNLSPVDLVYILFEIEQKLKIKICPELLEQYGFSSFDKICDVIQTTLAHA